LRTGATGSRSLSSSGIVTPATPVPVTDEHRVLRLTYDPSADAAYIYLQPATVIQPSVATTLPVNASVNLDFDDQGRLVGVEVLGARHLRPELLEEATEAP